MAKKISEFKLTLAYLIFSVGLFLGFILVMFVYWYLKTLKG